MSELPKGWAAATLNDLLGAGALFSDGDWVESKDQDPNGANRLLQLADIGDGVFIDKSSRYVNDEKFSSLNCTELKEGDVLIARMPDPLGRACLMPAMPRRCLTVVDVAVFRVGDTGVSNKWLMYFLNSSPVRQEIELNSSGTTRKRISRGKLGEIVLPIPPLAEQTRIAAKLDELLAQVDTLKARIDGIPTLLKRFRQSVLANAVSGRLTEEWRGGEEYFTETLMLTDLVDSSLVGLVRSAAEQSDEANYGTPYLKMNNISNDWGSALKSLVYVSVSEAEAERYSLAAGDWLFNTRNSQELVGKSCVWRDVGTSFVFNNNILRIRFSDRALPEFIEIWFRSPLGREALEKVKSATTSVAAVYQKALMSQTLPLPEIAEQTEIVRRVEQLFAFADQLEARVKTAQARIDRLTQSILAKAFRGELVPQGPNDEPASVLLERIKAQRAAAPKAKRGRRAATLS